MKEKLVFDFGGVLGSDSDLWDTNFQNVKRETMLPTEKLSEIFFLHWGKVKTGQMSTIDFWEEVIRHSGKVLDPKFLENLYLQGISINPEMINFAQDLKNKGYSLTILSNEAREWMEHKIKAFKLLSIFGRVYSSGELGMAKPNPLIFEYVLKDLNEKPENIIFIDNLERNTLAAEKHGIKTIVFKNLEELKNSLTFILSPQQ